MLKGELVQISHKDISVVCRDVQIVFQCNIKTEYQETMGEQRLGAEIPSLGKSSDHWTVFFGLHPQGRVCLQPGRKGCAQQAFSCLINYFSTGAHIKNNVSEELLCSYTTVPPCNIAVITLIRLITLQCPSPPSQSCSRPHKMLYEQNTLPWCELLCCD